MHHGGVGALQPDEQRVAEAVAGETCGYLQPSAPIVTDDQTGDALFDLGLEFGHLVLHRQSSSTLRRAAALWQRRPCVAARAGAPGRSGVKVERPQRSEDERP